MASSTIIKGVTEDSQTLVDMYLYPKKSASTIICALRRLYEQTKKADLTLLNYKDYVIYVKPYVNESAPAKFKRDFIKYLYGYDFLKNKNGFEAEYWNPEEIRDDFEKEKKERVKKEYKVVLSFEQIEKLLQVYSMNTEEEDAVKRDLSFYLCFFTEVENIGDLRDADSRDYRDGIWTINDRDYDIPARFDPYLCHLKGLQYSKFTAIHRYVADLGNSVGINKLHPSTLIKAREQMKIPCFLCGERYYVFKENWTVLNDKMLCNACAQKILADAEVKKKDLTDGLPYFDVDVLTREEKVNTTLAKNSFDTLRQDLPDHIDYAKLHEALENIGKLGEKYVLEYEKEYLKGTNYQEKVSMSPSFNHENGFDILSYERDGRPVMIEVKTTTGPQETPFYITERERQTAEKAKAEGKLYRFYRVSNIMAKDRKDIQLEKYDELSESDFEISGVLYRIRLQEPR